VTTTARYAHVNQNDLAKAAQAVADQQRAGKAKLTQEQSSPKNSPKNDGKSAEP